MARTLDDLRTWFGSLDGRRRAALGGATVLAVLAVGGVGTWASYTPWSALTERQTWDETLDAAAALEEAGISYRISDDGRLMVPSDRLGSARRAVASTTDLPALGDVSELQLGLTPAAQEWAFLRAREGDLARMINGIAGVSASQVHVVPRGESLFVGEERPASASVFVKLRPGVRLESTQVQAITRLVSGAVEGLEPSSVSVVDDRGNLLASGDGAPDPSGAEGTQEALVKLRAELERRYERAVGQALLPVLGYAGGFSATATVELDPTSLETVTKRIDPNGQAVLSEQLEESKSDREAPGGVPGVVSNLPDQPVTGVRSSGTRNERNATTASYAYPTVDEVARRPAGAIRHVSVAVQVDTSQVDALAKAGNVGVDEVKASIEAAVSAAVGVDQDRGDSVTVRFLPFAPIAAPTPVAAEAPIFASPTGWAQAALAALALGLLFVFGVRPLVRAAVGGPAPVPAAPAEPVPEPEPEEDLAKRLREMVDRFEPVDARDVSRLVDQHEGAAVQVLKRWRTKEIA